MDADSIWEYNCETREELHDDLEETAHQLVLLQEDLEQLGLKLEEVNAALYRTRRHITFLEERKRLVHQKMDELIGLELAAKALAKSGDLNESYDLLGYPPGYWNDQEAAPGTGTGSGILPEASIPNHKDHKDPKP